MVNRSQISHLLHLKLTCPPMTQQWQAVSRARTTILSSMITSTTLAVDLLDLMHPHPFAEIDPRLYLLFQNRYWLQRMKSRQFVSRLPSAMLWLRSPSRSKPLIFAHRQRRPRRLFHLNQLHGRKSGESLKSEPHCRTTLPTLWISPAECPFLPLVDQLGAKRRQKPLDTCQRLTRKRHNAPRNWEERGARTWLTVKTSSTLRTTLTGAPHARLLLMTLTTTDGMRIRPLPALLF